MKGGQKINKTKFLVVIGGRQSTIECNNQPNTRGSDGGSIEKDVRPAESAGGVIFVRSGGGRVGKGERIEKIDALIKLIIFLACVIN